MDPEYGVLDLGPHEWIRVARRLEAVCARKSKDLALVWLLVAVFNLMFTVLVAGNSLWWMVLPILAALSAGYRAAQEWGMYRMWSRPVGGPDA